MKSITAIDTKGIAEIFGCSRKHATDRITKHPNFPKPIINYSQKMRYWNKEEVINFAMKDQRQSAPKSHDSNALVAC